MHPALHPALHKVEIAPATVARIMARRGKMHVFDSIDPTRTAHIVVDLQNGFMAPGAPVEVPAARAIVPNVNRISAALRAAGGLVVYIQNTFDAEALASWSNYFNVFSTQARRELVGACFSPGNDGHALWPGLEVLDGDLKVRKSRYGAFIQGASELHTILQARGIDTVIITGTATNVCCESTARDAMMMNYKVLFVSDGTATFTDEEHNATLGIMAMCFADVVSTDETVALISAKSAIAEAAE